MKTLLILGGVVLLGAWWLRRDVEAVAPAMQQNGTSNGPVVSTTTLCRCAFIPGQTCKCGTPFPGVKKIGGYKEVWAL